MLRQARAARAVRLTLLIAALLAVGGSFGLHPEPAAASLGTTASGLSGIRDAPAAHGCLACLTHGVAFVSALGGLALAAAAPSPLFVFFEPPFAGGTAGRELSGRSPPPRF